MYCTGYKISFPFFDHDLLDPSGDNRIELYRRVVHPDLPGLYFIGLMQPLDAIMPIAERQSEWIADVLQGKVALPGRAEMVAEIDDDRGACASATWPPSDTRSRSTARPTCASWRWSGAHRAAGRTRPVSACESCLPVRTQ